MDIRLSRSAYAAIGIVLTDHRVSSFHARLYRRTAGRWMVGHALGVPMILLTTIGRRTGVARTNPLVAIQDGDAWLVVGSNGGRETTPSWVHNLRANPHAQVRYRADISRVVAREALDDEHRRRWKRAVEAYPGYAVYADRTSRPIPLFILEPA